MLQRNLFFKVRANKRVKVKKDGNKFFITMYQNNQFVDNYTQALKWIIASKTLITLPKFKKSVRQVIAVGDNGLQFNPVSNEIKAINTPSNIVNMYLSEYDNQINYLQHYLNLSDGALDALTDWIKNKIFDFVGECLDDRDLLYKKINQELIYPSQRIAGERIENYG